MLFDRVRKRLGKSFLAETQKDILTQVKFWMPSGSYHFDWAMGKGWPMGRLIEMFGEESKGKTTIGLLAIKQAQLLGGSGYFINSEHTFSPQLATSLGVDVTDKAIAADRFGYSDVKYLSEAFKAIDAAMEGYLDEYVKKSKKRKTEPNLSDHLSSLYSTASQLSRLMLTAELTLAKLNHQVQMLERSAMHSGTSSRRS